MYEFQTLLERELLKRYGNLSMDGVIGLMEAKKNTVEGLEKSGLGETEKAKLLRAEVVDLMTIWDAIARQSSAL